MNWKKLTLSGGVSLAVIAISASSVQAQSHARAGGSGGARIASHAGHGGGWNHGTGNHWNGGGHHWHHHHFHGGFGYPYGYGFYPYGWGYGFPYYGASAALYNNGYNDGRVYNGRAAGSGGGSVVAEVQQELARVGYYRGAVDGVIGDRTRSAIRAYERRKGLRVDGRIDDELLDSLGLS